MYRIWLLSEWNPIGWVPDDHPSTLIMTAWVHPDFFPCRRLFLQPILLDSVPQRSGRIRHSIQSSYSIEISMDRTSFLGIHAGCPFESFVPYPLWQKYHVPIIGKNRHSEGTLRNSNHFDQRIFENFIGMYLINPSQSVRYLANEFPSFREDK